MNIHERDRSSGRPTAASVLASAILVLLVGCAPRPAAETARTEFVLGTVCNIRLSQGGSAKLLDEAFALLHRLEAELSSNIAGSEIDAVNKAAGKFPVKVGPHAMAILVRDQSYSALSEGAFDASVGPLVALWGIGSARAVGEEGELPAESEIKTALGKVGWRDVVIDTAAGTVYLKRPGMALDLGSGTKGYATDLVVDILAKGGVKSAIIDLGGNIFVMGAKTGGKAWRVGLQNPDSERGSYLGIASLVDKTMVTSGVYERYFIHDGKRYHHILDTKTGHPVDNGLASVTIIAERSFDADGLTTMLFALGRERGMELGKKRGVDVIMVDTKKKVYLSSGVSKYFEITDTAYSYAE